MVSFSRPIAWLPTATVHIGTRGAITHVARGPREHGFFRSPAIRPESLSVVPELTLDEVVRGEHLSELQPNL